VPPGPQCPYTVIIPYSHRVCSLSSGAPTFRIGLFGLDKLLDVDKAVRIFEEAVAAIVGEA